MNSQLLGANTGEEGECIHALLGQLIDWKKKNRLQRQNTKSHNKQKMQRTRKKMEMLSTMNPQ